MNLDTNDKEQKRIPPKIYIYIYIKKEKKNQSIGNNNN